MRVGKNVQYIYNRKKRARVDNRGILKRLIIERHSLNQGILGTLQNIRIPPPLFYRHLVLGVVKRVCVFFWQDEGPEGPYTCRMDSADREAWRRKLWKSEDKSISYMMIRDDKWPLRSNLLPVSWTFKFSYGYYVTFRPLVWPVPSFGTPIRYKKYLTLGPITCPIT